jgi:hypothetical protein
LTATTAKTTQLRAPLARGKFRYRPAPATLLEGLLAQAAWVPVVYTGGHATGHRAITEQARVAGEVARAVSVPLIADAGASGAAMQAIKAALAEIMSTGSYTGIAAAGFKGLRQEVEDLIGLDAYYRIETETVEESGPS